MVDLDERILLQRAQQGDTAAFGEVVRRRQTAVYNVAYRLTGRREDAEDLTQEAFLRAYRALERFDTKRPFTPWVKRICTNLCLNWLSAKQQTQLTAADMARPGADAVSMDQWRAAGQTPEQSLLARERDAKLRAAILQLPHQQRAVLELRHFQELSYAEIAAALHLPLSTVKSDLFRARKRLQSMLRAQGERKDEQKGTSR